MRPYDPIIRLSNVMEHADKIVMDDWEGCKHTGSLKRFYDNNMLSEVYADICEIWQVKSLDGKPKMKKSSVYRWAWAVKIWPLPIAFTPTRLLKNADRSFRCAALRN